MEGEATQDIVAAAATKVADPLVDQAARVAELPVQLVLPEEADPVVHLVQAVEAALVVGLAVVLVVDPPVVHPTEDISEIFGFHS